MNHQVIYKIINLIISKLNEYLPSAARHQSFAQILAGVHMARVDLECRLKVPYGFSKVPVVCESGSQIKVQRVSTFPRCAAQGAMGGPGHPLFLTPRRLFWFLLRLHAKRKRI